MKTENINLTEKVTVYGTGKYAMMPKGAAFDVHPLCAKTLVAKGYATESASNKE